MPRKKADIIIKDIGRTSIELYIQIGTFFDGFKSMFLALAALSDDFLIMPQGNDQKFSLKISFSRNDTIQKNSL